MNNKSLCKIHLVAASISLILIGIHVGLHWKFIINILEKMISSQHIFQKVVGSLLLVFIMGFGCYGTVTYLLGSRLSIPFTTQSSSTRNPQGGSKKKPRQVEINPVKVLYAGIMFFCMTLFYAFLTYIFEYRVLIRKKITLK